MNNKLFNQILKEGQDLQGSLFAMLLVLTYYSNEKGECWPRMGKLAKDSHLKDRQAYEVIKELRERGYVRVLQKGSMKAPPLYRVAVPKGDDAAGRSQQLRQSAEVSAAEGMKSLRNGVPGQAGTNINPNKEQKGLTESPLDKREKRKCALRGCPRVTYEEFCTVHSEGGSR